MPQSATGGDEAARTTSPFWSQILDLLRSRRAPAGGGRHCLVGRPPARGDPAGRALVLWIVAALLATQPRFPREVVANFHQEFRQLDNDKTRPAGRPETGVE